MEETARKIKLLMTGRGLTLSTAESCTSGGMAAALTSVSGASEYFQGGVVVYQDCWKEHFLQVPAGLIARHGVVSRPVVEQMVRGACRLFGTDYALASTGFTGEGADGLPAGTIWLGWGSAGAVHSLCLTGDFGRKANTERAVRTGLEQLLGMLEGDESQSAR